MVEEQIQIEILVTHFEVDLPPDESEARAEFQEKALHMVHQCLFYLTFSPWVSRAEKVEKVRVFENLRSQV